MSKQKFAFDKTNFILLAVGMAGGGVWFYFDDRSCIYTDAFRTGYFQCKTYQGGSTGLPFGVCVYDIRCVA